MTKAITKITDMKEQLFDKAGMMLLRMNRRKEQLFMDESGIGTIEMVLILVVLIVLVVVFRDGLKQVLEDIIKEINTEAGKVWTVSTG